jgi:hypothetical protein
VTTTSRDTPFIYTTPESRRVISVYMYMAKALDAASKQARVPSQDVVVERVHAYVARVFTNRATRAMFLQTLRSAHYDALLPAHQRPILNWFGGESSGKSMLASMLSTVYPTTACTIDINALGNHSVLQDQRVAFITLENLDEQLSTRVIGQLDHIASTDVLSFRPLHKKTKTSFRSTHTLVVISRTSIVDALADNGSDIAKTLLKRIVSIPFTSRFLTPDEIEATEDTIRASNRLDGLTPKYERQSKSEIMGSTSVRKQAAYCDAFRNYVYQPTLW